MSSKQQNIKVMLSVGCNANHEEQMDNARKRLECSFPGITFTNAILTPACGNPDDTTTYSNMLGKFYTEIPEAKLNILLKDIEKELGDTEAKRKDNIIMMDLDILEYAEERRHNKDWERPYIKQLIRMIFSFFLVYVMTLSANAQSVRSDAGQGTRKQDTELLGKAVEYYQGGKYHEAVLAFEKLQKSYRLNPRFKAYLGYSYYKEGEYENAIQYLSDAIPELESYSPKERAVYCYSCAESYFLLSRYEESIRYYSEALPMTEGNDKGDVYYHTAFAYYQLEKYAEALVNFTEAINNYVIGDNNELHKARKSQAEKMLRWLRKNANNEK